MRAVTCPLKDHATHYSFSPYRQAQIRKPKPISRKEVFSGLLDLRLKAQVELRQETAFRLPERRCSSRTFRYGYLVTT